MNPLNTLDSKGKTVNFSSLLAVCCLLMAGCASTPSNTTNSVANPVDPYEDINRKVFSFNDNVDNYVAEPIAKTYKKVTPQFLQTGVFNFFTNLKNINVVLNDLLQAKFEQSGQDTGRFLVNSTIGVGGLFDVAKNFGLEQHDEDFEQTLAVWGVPQGSYLVLPLLGPVTTRGIPGAVFDTAANPANYVGAPVQLVSLLNSRANAEGSIKFVKEASLDSYVFTRESFLQWRNHLATDGQGDSTNDLTAYEDELLSDANPQPPTNATTKTPATSSNSKPASSTEAEVKQ